MGGQIQFGTKSFLTNTNRYEMEINRFQLEVLLSKFNLNLLLNEGYIVLIVGKGGQSFRFYESIKKIEGITMLNRFTFLPKFLRFLRHYISGEGGLMKITKEKALNDVFLKLADNSLVEIIILPTNEILNLSNLYGDSYINTINFLNDQNDYFYLMVDGDNTDSSTGKFLVCAVGENSSDTIRKLYMVSKHILD